MKEKTEYLKEYNKIKKDIHNIAQKLFEKYNFLDMSIKKFETLVGSVLEFSYKSYKEDKKIDFIKYFYQNINLEIKKIIRKSIKENNNILEKYIDQKLKYTKNPQSNLEQLKYLGELFTSVNYMPEINLIINLLKTNEKLNKIVKSVFEEYKNIVLEDINELPAGEVGRSFVEAYVIINEEEQEENLTVDKVYDDDYLDSKDLTGQYLKEICKAPLLSYEETNRLLIEASQGSIYARNLLVERNMKLVVSIARRYTGRGVPLVDLVQEGSFGLMKAIERYDINSGNRLSTYATWWIRQAISRYIYCNGNNIRVPVHMQEIINKYTSAQKSLTLELKREPTQEEIRKKLNVDQSKIDEIVRVIGSTNMMSLNFLVGDKDETEFGELIADDSESVESQYENVDMQANIFELLKDKLSEKQFNVVIRRHGLCGFEKMTLEEIGSVYGITRERVRQIEEKAYSILRRPNNRKKLCSYIDLDDNSELESDSKKGLTIYQRIGIYDTEIIRVILSGLSEENINLLKNNLTKKDFEILASTNGLDGFEKLTNADLAAKNKVKIEDIRVTQGNIYEKIKKLLKRPEFSNVDDIDTTLKKIMERILTKLNSREKELLYKIYGTNLEKSFTQSELDQIDGANELIYKIKVIFSVFRGEKNQKQLYELFSKKYTKEQINRVIECLDLEEINLLKLKYGNNFDECLNDINDDEMIYILYKIVPKIENKLTLSLLSIYEKLNEYSIEQIDEALSKLSQEDLNILYSIYGEDLKNPTIQPNINKNQISKLNKSIIKKMVGLIKNPKKNTNLDNKPKNAKKSLENKSIYEILSNYSNEEVDSVLLSLSNEEKSILYLKYGNDLKNPKFNEMSQEDNFLLRSLIKKIKKSIDNKRILEMKKNQTIYELLNQYTEEQINDAISRLSDEDKQNLFLIYGEDLKTPNFDDLEFVNNNLNKLLSKIKTRIRKPDLVTQNNYKNIYMRIKQYSVEEINDAISKLSKEDQEIIYSIYGQDLEKTTIKKLSKEDDNKIRSIVFKIKKIILVKKQSEKTIYQRLDSYTKEEIDNAISRLLKEDKDLLFLIYGEDLNNIPQHELFFDINKVNSLVNKIVARIKNPKLGLIETDKLEKQKEMEFKTLTKEEYEVILDALKNPIFSELLTIIPPKEAIIVTLILSNNPNYTIDSIANLVGIEPDKVREITINTLNLYKNSLNQFIDEVIEKTAQLKI